MRKKELIYPLLFSLLLILACDSEDQINTEFPRIYEFERVIIDSIKGYQLADQEFKSLNVSTYINSLRARFGQGNFNSMLQSIKLLSASEVEIDYGYISLPPDAEFSYFIEGEEVVVNVSILGETLAFRFLGKNPVVSNNDYTILKNRFQLESTCCYATNRNFRWDEIFNYNTERFDEQSILDGYITDDILSEGDTLVITYLSELYLLSD